MKNYTEIPVIDVSPLFFANGEADLRDLAREVREVYTTIGFAYIVNHGIPPHLINSVFEQARLFHYLREDEKLKIMQNPFFRGYMPLGMSTFKLSTLGQATNSNQSAAFILGHEVSEIDPDFQAGINLAGPNQWPSDSILPNFKSTLLHYRENLSVVAKSLIRIFSLSFGKDYYDLDQYFMPAGVWLRLQYYPRQPKVLPEHQYGIAPHTDYGFLTLLAQDNVGGLQVKQPDDTWLNVAPLEGGLLLNTGDMLRRMSNDTYISTPHRVVNTSGEERYSVPFFFEPNMHACLSPVLTENGAPLHDPIKYADYLMARVKGNYEINAQ